MSAWKRNVLCSAIPSLSDLRGARSVRVCEECQRTSSPKGRLLTMKVWLDKKLVAGEAPKDFERLYGEFYLRKGFVWR